MAENRFSKFNPEERLILGTLLQNHANTVAEIGLAMDVRCSEYLRVIERLENEAKDA